MFFLSVFSKTTSVACVSIAVDLSYRFGGALGLGVGNVCERQKVDSPAAYFPRFISLLNRNNVNLPVL